MPEDLETYVDLRDVVHSFLEHNLNPPYAQMMIDDAKRQERKNLLDCGVNGYKTNFTLKIGHIGYYVHVMTAWNGRPIMQNVVLARNGKKELEYHLLRVDDFGVLTRLHGANKVPVSRKMLPEESIDRIMLKALGVSENPN